MYMPYKGLPPRYNWNIVESGVKHHKPNQTYKGLYCLLIQNDKYMYESIGSSVQIVAASVQSDESVIDTSSPRPFKILTRLAQIIQHEEKRCIKY